MPNFGLDQVNAFDIIIILIYQIQKRKKSKIKTKNVIQFSFVKSQLYKLNIYLSTIYLYIIITQLY